MVHEKNVKLMTKIAIYEKNKGKQEIPMTEYYKGDYVRLNTLKSIVGGTIAFGIILIMVGAYYIEYLMANIMKMDYKQLGINILTLYIGVIVIYWLIARIVYARRYDKARPNIVEYNHDLKKLQDSMNKHGAKKTIPKGGVVIHDDFIDF